MGGEGGVVSMKRRYRDWRGKQWAGVGASDNTLSLVRVGSDSVVSVAGAYFGGRKPLSGLVSQRSNSCRAAICLMAAFTAWSKRQVAASCPRNVSDPCHGPSRARSVACEVSRPPAVRLEGWVRSPFQGHTLARPPRITKPVHRMWEASGSGGLGVPWHALSPIVV
jgi:hypothetical protein